MCKDIIFWCERYLGISLVFINSGIDLYFSNPPFFKPLNNSNQKKFLSPQSNTVIWPLTSLVVLKHWDSTVINSIKVDLLRALWVGDGEKSFPGSLRKMLALETCTEVKLWPDQTRTGNSFNSGFWFYGVHDPRVVLNDKPPHASMSCTGVGKFGCDRRLHPIWRWSQWQHRNTWSEI